MAPPENSSNWLTFSLSPMEMLTTSSATPHSQMLVESATSTAPFDVSSSADAHHYHFFDNLYADGWVNPKDQAMYTEEANRVAAQGMDGSDSIIFTSFMDSQLQQQQVAPKLEDFLGGDSASLVRYSDSQTETQDSSLTHIYEQGGRSGAYFSDQQDLKAIAATARFQAFSTNSGSEVDDSASAGRTQVGCGEFPGQSIESGYSQRPTGSLSLGVNTHNSQKAIVTVDSEGTKKVADTFGQRTSIYRGVTRHRWTGRYEAHLWDNSCRREGQARKGRQVYLGGYDKEDKAARSYDLAALKYWGPTATTNFPVSNYGKELEEMKHVTKQEFIASLRRKSSGFSRGASIYRGVTRHHQQGRWQARIGRVAGNKDLYLGTFATEEEAAEAYDIAAIKFRGVNAVTNFEMGRYDVEAIAKSALPIGGAAKRLKLSLEEEQKVTFTSNQHCSSNTSSSISFGGSGHSASAIPCGVPLDATVMLYHHNLFHQMESGHAASDTSGSLSVPSMATPYPLLPSSAELFIWPNQSY